MAEGFDLERLYDSHAQALFAFVLQLTSDEAETRDVLQEIFVRLARRPELLAGVRDERGFLLRLSRNLTIDWVRRREARDRAHETTRVNLAEVFLPLTDPDEEAFRRALEVALGTLPLEQRTVVYLKLWEGLTFDAIAETLEIPLNTAASRYRYALDKLRDQLRPLYDEIR
ncbi:MAG: sigma-70 family RNA polymerase sigma factor [Verrucomicrobia bacterium]|nr:sigma-70 family RNA polymerase sigma factor [Verrucomicrobiota bacterium]